MSDKQDLSTFRALLEKAFSMKTEKNANQLDFDDKYQHAFKAYYEPIAKIIVGVKGADLISALMSTFLDLADKYRANANNVHYYRSEQTFGMLVTQSGHVKDDPTLFETWDARLSAPADPKAPDRMRVFYMSLGVTAKSVLDHDREAERARRRKTRSMFELLHDEYRKQKGHPVAKDDDLYDFDPRPFLSPDILNAQIGALRAAWNTSRGADTPEVAGVFNGMLTGFANFLRNQGKSDAFLLVQTIKQLQDLLFKKTVTRTDPVTGRTTSTPPPAYDFHGVVLVNALYAIACVELVATARTVKLLGGYDYGLKPDEIEYFEKPLAKSTRFASNFRAVLRTKKPESPDALLGVMKVFLDAYGITIEYKDFDLVPLKKTLEIQDIWADIQSVTEKIEVAARHDDPKELEAIFYDPKNATGVARLKEVTTTTYELQNPWELGKGTIAAGSQLGPQGTRGAVSVTYISPDRARQIYVELSSFKPFLFMVSHAYADDKVFVERIHDIARSAAFAGDMLEIVFLIIGFLPTLVDGGFGALIYEIVLALGANEVEKQVAKVSPAFAKVLSFLILTVTPRPNFGTEVEGLTRTASADETGLSHALNTERGGAIADRAVAGDSRALAETAETVDKDLEEMINSIPIEDEFQSMNSGVTPADVKKALAKLGKKRAPPGWGETIRQSKPLQALIRKAKNVKFVKIMSNRMKGLPAKYQVSSMGSEYELWLTVNGKKYQLDGIIMRDGKSYIGESKFTSFDAFEGESEGMESFNIGNEEDEFVVGGKGDATSSPHYSQLDEKVAQLEKYSDLARDFGFEGVAVYTNTQFLWSTFEQVSRSMGNVEVLLEKTASAFERGTNARGIGR